MKCLSERFYRKVDNVGDGALCWIWNASLTRGGYGQIRVKKKNGRWTMARAHRVSWELHYGKIPKKLKVLHRCDNPRCISPYHLFLGTTKDNYNDMKEKGRRRFGFFSKISSEIALEIRNSTKKNRELAQEFGLGLTQISYIKNNKRWKVSGRKYH